jgi:hypothetical protein
MGDETDECVSQMETLKMIVVGQQRASRAIDAADSTVARLGAGTAEVKRGLQGIMEASRSRRQPNKTAGSGGCENCCENCSCDTTQAPSNIFLPQFSRSIRHFFSPGEKDKQPTNLSFFSQSISSFVALPEANKSSMSVIPAGLSLGPAQELRERLAVSDALKGGFIKDTKLETPETRGTADSAGAGFISPLPSPPSPLCNSLKFPPNICSNLE